MSDNNPEPDAPAGKAAKSAGSAKQRTARRRFIRSSLLTGGIVGLALLGYLPVARASRTRLRPPGALDEKDFLASCIKCGQCVQVCPVQAIKLGDLTDGYGVGVPHIDAREQACDFSCDAGQCILACPTGALDHGLTDINQARMGLAVLLDQETCLNFLGLRCDVCYRVCPLTNQAITLEMHHNERTGKHAFLLPVVHTDKCTGCGKCEKACVLDEAAIKVLPHAQAVGELGKHYRLGWKEKEKAGKALIDDNLQLPIRGMEQGLPGPERNSGGGFKEFKP